MDIPAATGDHDDVDVDDDDLNPVQRVVAAAHAGRLTQQHLEDVQVDVLDGDEDIVKITINHFSDLVVDSWPEPESTEDLADIFETAKQNIVDHVITPATSPPEEPTDQDYDADETNPTLPDTPKNVTCSCESALSGADSIKESKGKWLRLHFFFGSGNLEVRTTENGVTQGDLIALESVYAMWMIDNTVHIVLSCPSTARKLKDGRWREAAELSMFPSNKPMIKVKVKEQDVVNAASAIDVCRRMHPSILLQPERVPRAFNDDVLARRAAEYRAKLVHSRLPPHIQAFVTRKDENVSDADRAAANSRVTSLVSYCRHHWRLYVDTVLLKKHAHGFPQHCLSCDAPTRWSSKSGLRIGCDGKDHQYCKKFSANILPSMTKMLALPTIKTLWKKVRKSYDITDDNEFKNREAAKELATDLGYV